MTDPVNQLHHTLRVLSQEDATLQRAISWVHHLIGLRGYDTVKADPGMEAWVMENKHTLGRIAAARRAAYAASQKPV